MNRVLGVCVPLLLILAPGCKPRATRVPDWVRSAPAEASMAVSGRVGWLLERQELQAVVSRNPLAEQVLDLFLKRTGILSGQETGRVTFYLMGTHASKDPAGAFLLQFGGFRDPAAFQRVVAETFPAEGVLRLRRSELPLFVVLDVNQVHVRVAVDRAGRAWVGDLQALSHLEEAQGRTRSLDEAAEWLPAQAPLMGVFRVDALLASGAARLPGAFSREIPQGVEALAWALTPATEKGGLHRIDLVLSGSREGIRQAMPWLQRLLALTSSVKGSGQQASELFQEPRRAGLRCSLSSQQFELLAERLGQAGLKLPAPVHP